MKIESQKTLLKEHEAAALLSISRRKLWSLRQAGEIPHVRIDRCVRYDIRDLEAAIARMKKGGDA